MDSKGADVPVDLTELPQPLSKFEAMFQVSKLHNLPLLLLLPPLPSMLCCSCHKTLLVHIWWTWCVLLVAAM